MATVLMVDDDHALVRLVSVLLSVECIHVERAYSGEEGLAFLRSGRAPPDLILLDLVMPGMGGREFFREARQAGYAGPVLFCSSRDAVTANAELGGQGAIEKPFDPEALVACVRRQLGAADSHQLATE